MESCIVFTFLIDSVLHFTTYHAISIKSYFRVSLNSQYSTVYRVVNKSLCLKYDTKKKLLFHKLANRSFLAVTLKSQSSNLG